MAGETVVLSSGDVSTLIQVASALIVAVIAGLAARFGWVKAKDKLPDEHPVSKASENNSDAVVHLTRTIQLLIDRMLEMHEDTNRREKRERELIEELTDDIRRLIHHLKLMSAEKGT